MRTCVYVCDSAKNVNVKLCIVEWLRCVARSLRLFQLEAERGTCQRKSKDNKRKIWNGLAFSIHKLTCISHSIFLSHACAQTQFIHYICNIQRYTVCTMHMILARELENARFNHRFMYGRFRFKCLWRVRFIVSTWMQSKKMKKKKEEKKSAYTVDVEHNMKESIKRNAKWMMANSIHTNEWNEWLAFISLFFQYSKQVMCCVWGAISVGEIYENCSWH